MGKPTRPLIWSPEAESDLFDVWRWGVRHFSTEIADKHLRDLAEGARRLCDFPESGRTRDDLLPDLRAIVVLPTVMFYRLVEDRVEIIRVVDGRRNLAAIFERNDGQ